MSDTKNLGVLSLYVCLGGVLLGVAVSMIGHNLQRNFNMHGLGVFAVAQVAGIVLGLMSRDALGRSVAILSSLLLVASFVMLS